MACSSVSVIPSDTQQFGLKTHTKGACEKRRSSLGSVTFASNTSKTQECSKKCPMSLWERTIVVFDWDDTLCPSTWLHTNDLLPKYRGQTLSLTKEQRETLNTISANVVRLLKKAVSFGPVFIVTAAEYGWVELSCALFMPSVREVLEIPDIHIVSARTWYEQTFGSGGDSNCWKFEVMQLIAQKCFSEEPTSPNLHYNFISIGDSMAERDACHLAIEDVPSTYAKTLKFVENPSSDELTQQLMLTFDSFDQMCLWESSLDLQLTQAQLHQIRSMNS